MPAENCRRGCERGERGSGQTQPELRGSAVTRERLPGGQELFGCCAFPLVCFCLLMVLVELRCCGVVSGRAMLLQSHGDRSNFMLPN